MLSKVILLKVNTNMAKHGEVSSLADNDNLVKLVFMGNGCFMK